MAARPQDVEFTDLRVQAKSIVRRVRVHGASGDVEMIEKLARTKHEARFYAWRRALRDRPEFELIPRAFATRIDRLSPSLLFHTAATYMEALETGSNAGLAIADYAGIIAGIAPLGAHGPPLPARATLTLTALRRFAAAARRDGVSGDAAAALERMGTVAPDLLASERFRRIPLVLCHNDMHRANIGYRRGAAGPVPVIMDWEAAGMNRAGSDLDRLFPADPDPEAEAGFRAAVTAYGAALGAWRAVDAADLELAAGAFALNRRISRSLRAQGAERRRRIETVLLTWRQLAARAGVR